MASASWHSIVVMEEGSKNKKTIFVGGLSDDLDQTTLIETFGTFGDIIDVQIPSAQTNGRPGPSVPIRICSMESRLLA